MTIAATATGYVGGSTTLQVTDAESLSLSIVSTTISERGGSTSAAVTRSNTNTDLPLTVSLTSSDTSAANVPVQVTIPAGQQSVSFVISAVDDNNLDGDQAVTIGASASGYTAATSNMNVSDFEELVVESTSVTLSERQGTTTGRVRRSTADLSQPLLVILNSDDNTELTVPVK